jgi:subtilisin family serine protease
MDTGIDADHEDLTVVDGVKIIKGVTTEDVYNDDNGHGTHCAGIIAAKNNDLGVVGVACSASLYAIKVLDSGGSGYYTDMIKGLDWAISHGVHVVSMSFGGQTSTKAFESACKNAQSKGLVLVAAAGNGGNAKVLYPAAYSSVIAVGATDSSNARASSSSYGSQLDIMAPGVGIYSTYNDGGYTTLSGTSMACPHVSGTVALVLATKIPATYDANKNGIWDPTEVQNCLQKTATDLGTAGWDKYTGYGLVNAYAAVGGT